MRIHRSLHTMAVLLALCLTAAGSIFAQSGAVGIYRTKMFYTDNVIRVTSNELRFVIYYNNNTGFKSDVANGFVISSPDGAVWESAIIHGIGDVCPNMTPEPFDDYCWFLPYFDFALAFFQDPSPGYGADTVGFIAAGAPNRADRQMPAGWNDSVYAITIYLDPETINFGKTICIDSAFFPPGGAWEWYTNAYPDHPTFIPDWLGLPPVFGGTSNAFCFTLGDPALLLDWDQDGIYDSLDNCMYVANPDQLESDGDGLGDACDNCPYKSNPDQTDNNNDGIGNACCCVGTTGDINGDGVVDGRDLAWLVALLTSEIGQRPVFPCPAEANVNGSGIIDIGDLALLVAYLTSPPDSRPALPPCP